MEAKNTPPAQEPKPPTPAQLIAREKRLIHNLCRIALLYNYDTFLEQLNKAIEGCNNRIRAIQVQNGLEVTE